MNILIIGHRQHGKTDIGVMLAKVLNTKALDSSRFSCEHVVYPVLKDKYGYDSPEACYEDRGNHRQEWFELIEAYNDVPDRLTRAILDEGTIYVGMRSRKEFDGSNHHFNVILWVDASDRVPEEPSTSMKLTKEDADYVLDNNGPMENIPNEIERFLAWTQEINAADEVKATYGIDVNHHLARGTLHSFVLEQLLNDSASTQNPDIRYGDDIAVAFDGTDFKAHCSGSLQGLNVSEGTVRKLFPEYNDLPLYCAGYFRQQFPNQGWWSLDASKAIKDTDHSWNDIQEKVTDWARTTYPDGTMISRFEHIIDELDEIIAAPKDKFEYADVLLIFMHEAKEQGISMDELLEACYQKFDIVQRRTHKRQQAELKRLAR